LREHSKAEKVPPKSHPGGGRLSRKTTNKAPTSLRQGKNAGPTKRRVGIMGNGGSEEKANYEGSSLGKKSGQK